MSQNNNVNFFIAPRYLFLCLLHNKLENYNNKKKKQDWHEKVENKLRKKKPYTFGQITTNYNCKKAVAIL